MEGKITILSACSVLASNRMWLCGKGFCLARASRSARVRDSGFHIIACDFSVSVVVEILRRGIVASLS